MPCADKAIHFAISRRLLMMTENISANHLIKHYHRPETEQMVGEKNKGMTENTSQKPRDMKQETQCYFLQMYLPMTLARKTK